MRETPVKQSLFIEMICLLYASNAIDWAGATSALMLLEVSFAEARDMLDKSKEKVDWGKQET